MNGAESLVHSLLKSGVDTCFANPGTSEMHFVAALDQIPGMKCVLGLHETVVTGMADGYFRIAGKPACTLLHCGPGLANGMANLHNARRAHSGVVNIVGDHATYHRKYDSPLNSETATMAGTVSDWLCTSEAAETVGRDGAAAVAAARSRAGQVATLILPSDASWGGGGQVCEPIAVPAADEADPIRTKHIARILTERSRVLILLAGQALSLEAQSIAWAIAHKAKAAVMADYVIGKIARGQGALQLERVPYSTDQAVGVLDKYDHIVLVNAKAPVAFFAHPGKPSIQYRPDAEVHILSTPNQDAVAALRALAEELQAPPQAIPAAGPRPDVPTGAPTPEALAQAVAAVMPENAIVSDESISFGRGFYQYTYAAPQHDWLHLAGGAIGDGMPVATGAAVAGAGRRVINLQADGSAMYSLQSLWTQARQNLPVTTVILNNKRYNILLGEFKNVGAVPGVTALEMLDLSQPNFDWLKIANGFGVEAARATTVEACADLMRASFNRTGPFLIDLQI